MSRIYFNYQWRPFGQIKWNISGSSCAIGEANIRSFVPVCMLNVELIAETVEGGPIPSGEWMLYPCGIVDTSPYSTTTTTTTPTWSISSRSEVLNVPKVSDRSGMFMIRNTILLSDV